MLEKILKDKAFLERIMEKTTSEEIQAEFLKEGVEISLEEIKAIPQVMALMAQKGKTSVSEEELDRLSGGLSMTKKVMIGASTIVGILGVDAIQGFVRAEGDGKLEKLKNIHTKSLIIQGVKGACKGITDTF